MANDNEQDLVRALESVGATASSGDAIPVTTTTSSGPGASTFPTIEQLPPPLSQDPPASSSGFVTSSQSSGAPTDSVPAAPALPTDDAGPLAAVKQDALMELRPLVDKLNVSPEEKFDTYLLLIRSTDDVNLIAPAHEAAKLITDETRRAEALLDIIKEIDYLSHPKSDQ